MKKTLNKIKTNKIKAKKTKILFLCDTLPTNPNTRDRLPAIKEAGKPYNLIIEDLFAFESEARAHSIRSLPQDKMKEYFQKADIGRLNKQFMKRIEAHNPDITILATLDCFSLFIEYVPICKLVVGFFGDDEYMLHRNAHWLNRFYKSVCYVKWVYDYYYTIAPGRVYYLPQACHFPETDFSKLSNTKKVYDALFIGSPFGDRAEILNQLVESGVNLSIFGSVKWNRYDSLKPFYKGFIPSHKYDAEIRKAKVFISLLGNHINGAPHLTSKAFDGIKNGVATVHTHHPSLLSDYGLVEGKSLAMAKDLNHLVELVNKLLIDDKKCATIAMAAFKRIQKYNYTAQYSKLFKTLDKEAKE